MSTRRDFLKAGMVAGAALGARSVTGAEPGTAAAAPSPAAGATKPVIVASANGLGALDAAMARLQSGADALDAVIAAANVIEDDPNDITVGYGGLPNERGVVQLDASVMHGPSRSAGAVASLENIRFPTRVARLVMERTDHVLLVGPGALEFARMHGFQEENLLTEKARRIWLHWKETLSDKDDWFSSAESAAHPDVRNYFRTQGTVHFGALDKAGNLSGTTTTSGLAFKIPGRVGDTPLIGAGLYLDNDVGSCGSTGRGEAVILTSGSRSVVEQMARGLSPEAACLKVLERIADWTRAPHLLDADGRPDFNVNFYALNRRGEVGGAALWSGSSFAVHDGVAAARRESAFLFRKKG